jgi:hypothetical protein
MNPTGIFTLALRKQRSRLMEVEDALDAGGISDGKDSRGSNRDAEGGIRAPDGRSTSFA